MKKNKQINKQANKTKKQKNKKKESCSYGLQAFFINSAFF